MEGKPQQNQRGLETWKTTAKSAKTHKIYQLMSTNKVDVAVVIMLPHK